MNGQIKHAKEEQVFAGTGRATGNPTGFVAMHEPDAMHTDANETDCMHKVLARFMPTSHMHVQTLVGLNTCWHIFLVA